VLDRLTLEKEEIFVNNDELTCDERLYNLCISKCRKDLVLIIEPIDFSISYCLKFLYKTVRLVMELLIKTNKLRLESF